jgi:hypothetical protein
MFSKLNETGRIWRANGLRFEEEGEWAKVKKLPTIPISLELEVEGKYDETTTSGAKTTSSDMLIEEVEIISGGAFGTDGRVSAYGAIAIQQNADGTASSVMHNAYIQINDIAGPKGAGRLNLKAGKSSFGLPFLADYQKAINNRYLGERTLDVLTMGLRLVELNGVKVTEDEESWAPTHYYSLGVARENVQSSHKFKSFYATYSANFKERYSIGGIYRRGYETNAAGTADVEYEKFGVAAEAELGPVVLTAGWFGAKYDTDPDKTNYLIEALYMPSAKIGFGARYDTLKEDGKKSAVATSVMTRYNILTNAFAQLEFRKLIDGDYATGLNEKEKKVRLFLVTLF